MNVQSAVYCHLWLQELDYGWLQNFYILLENYHKPVLHVQIKTQTKTKNRNPRSWSFETFKRWTNVICNCNYCIQLTGLSTECTTEMHICVIVDYAPHGVRIVQTIAQCTISAWTRVPFKLCLCAQCSKHFTAVNSKFNSNNIYSITLAGERVVCQCNFTVFLRQIFWCHNCFFF